MYLIGAELTGKTGFASMVLVHRVRKDLKKYYHVINIKRLSFDSNGNNLIKEVFRIYNDRKYTTRKPRFSQIGRPKKMVNEKPLIFTAFCDYTVAEMQYLKKRNIQASCIFFNDESKWRTEIPGKCLKSDFYISKNTLISTILGVIEQDRLIMTNKESGEELFEAFNEYRKIKDAHVSAQDVKPLEDLVLALAMPVWYYENLLAIRSRRS